MFSEPALRTLHDLAQDSSSARKEFELCSETFRRNLAELLTISPPMLDSLRLHPDWIGWLRSSADQRKTGFELKDDYYECAWKNWISDEESPTEPMEKLCALKRRETLLIAYRDIAGLSSFEQTIDRLSSLAEWVIVCALSHCWATMEEQRPSDLETAADPKGFAIFALGKLGGHELNYSSDVDLIFFRRSSEDPGELRFFTRLGQRLVRALSHAGYDGFLYRVDMRLRPYGESGALVPSVSSLVSYYESWGEPWERQALIKARFIGGEEDLGRRFGDFVADFTFARQMDDSSLEEIKRVKYRSEKEYSVDDDRIHLKQGPGGIRDIEFYVQYLQLIGGCEHRRVCTGSTIAAIDALAEAKLLLDGEPTQLALAYRFLRTVEHRLQLQSMTPSAILPGNPKALASLAHGLGFRGEETAAATDFLSILDQYRNRIRSILERIYLTPGYLSLREKEEELAQLLSERTPKKRVRQFLSSYRFQDPDKAWQNIRLMALGPAGRILPPGERRSFLSFAMTLLAVIKESLDPDLALHHLESFAAATGNRVSFLRALASRRPHLARLSNLLAFSTLSHQILIRHPEYFDSLARGVHLQSGRDWERMYEELGERLRSSPHDEGIDIRTFRQRETIRIAYRDLAGLADSLEISRELSALADACLITAVEVTSKSANSRETISGSTLVALGKTGSRQMHYGSDLDLVFFYEDPEDGASPEQRARLQRIHDRTVEKTLDLLAGVTSEGVVYQVDLRLRPEGPSGLLARSWSSFFYYAQHYMQPWERMALVRSRVVGHSKEHSERWHRLLDKVVYSFHWDEESLGAIRQLKRRIEAEKNRESRLYLDFKYGKGGISDLEFLVQFLQVLHGENNPEVRSPGVVEALTALQDVGALTARETRDLFTAHKFQRLVENHYQLMEEWTSREISRESLQLVRMARSLGFFSESTAEDRRAFLNAWDEHARVVRRLVEKYFYNDAPPGCRI